MSGEPVNLQQALAGFSEIYSARIVGRDNVIAGTDCGLGGRVHPQIAWAKLDSLAKGAEIATRRLYG